MEVNTSNRLKLVVMIYDAAIASLKQASQCRERNDITKMNYYISRTQLIVNELNNTLDFKQGKEIATTLSDLYYFINRHLADVIKDRDSKKIEESMNILMQLKEAWEEITQKADTIDSTFKNVPKDDVKSYPGRGSISYG